MFISSEKKFLKGSTSVKHV